MIPRAVLRAQTRRADPVLGQRARRVARALGVEKVMSSGAECAGRKLTGQANSEVLLAPGVIVRVDSEPIDLPAGELRARARCC